MIKDYDINRFPVFSQVMTEIIESGCMDHVEYFGIVNCNMGQYITKSFKNPNPITKIEFLKNLSNRATLGELDLRQNNLNVP
jgi:hypothetical protein